MTRKIAFFEGWSWFKFNKLGLTLGTNVKFCISVAKGLKLKVRNILGVTLTFVEITGKKLVEGAFLLPPPSILNRVKKETPTQVFPEYSTKNLKSLFLQNIFGRLLFLASSPMISYESISVFKTRL